MDLTPLYDFMDFEGPDYGVHQWNIHVTKGFLDVRLMCNDRRYGRRIPVVTDPNEMELLIQETVLILRHTLQENA